LAEAEALGTVFKAIDETLGEHVENVLKLTSWSSVVAGNKKMEDCARPVEKFFEWAGGKAIRSTEHKGRASIFISIVRWAI
jgi:hypothetical protein